MPSIPFYLKRKIIKMNLIQQVNESYRIHEEKNTFANVSKAAIAQFEPIPNVLIGNTMSVFYLSGMAEGNTISRDEWNLENLLNKRIDTLFESLTGCFKTNFDSIVWLLIPINVNRNQRRIFIASIHSKMCCQRKKGSNETVHIKYFRERQRNRFRPQLTRFFVWKENRTRNVKILWFFILA